MIEHELGHPVCVDCRRDISGHEEITLLNVNDQGADDMDEENYICLRCYLARIDSGRLDYDRRAFDIEELRETAARIEGVS